MSVRGTKGAICAAALVVALFCLPLFAGLRGWDLRNDEAIYSYAVDRILETGDWLTPRTLPLDHAFLEKPPLKFWLVAAPIRAGLLPHDEFGLRFMDPLLGSIAFLYVFAIGWRLAGVLSGLVAVFVLFTFEPLLFEHGLRSNNMESALLLAYAAGAYHLGRWLALAGQPSARFHALAVSLAFVLAFMTKFVAAAFVPIIGVLVVLWERGLRGRGAPLPWRDWLAPAALAALLIAPWFLYQFALHGRLLYDVMVGQHVVERFTDSLDPSHLQPWHYYVTAAWAELTRAGTAWPVAIGTGLLAAAAWRREATWPRLLLLWLVVPLVLMSLGTSKILHYAYPLLPPAALGAGYAAAEAARVVSRGIEAMRTRLGRRLPLLAGTSAGAADRRRFLRPVSAAAGAVAVLALAVGLWTLLTGDLRLRVAEDVVVTNSSLVRPFAVAAVLLALSGRTAATGRVVALATFAAMAPVGHYQAILATTQTVDHPLRTLRDCILSVRHGVPDLEPGVYNAAAETAHHSYNYYLRGIGPVTYANEPDRDALRQHLVDDAQPMPVVLSSSGYDAYAEEGRQARRAVGAEGTAADTERWLTQPHTGVAPDHAAVILTPTPYAHCAGQAAAAGGRLVGDVPPAGPDPEHAF